MSTAEQLFARVEQHDAGGSEIRAGSREAVLRLSRFARPIATDFLLLLVDSRLDLLGAWKLPRAPGGVHGFGLAEAVQLASRAKAAGLILVEERDQPLIPRRPDLDLDRQIRLALAETGIDLVDHLLVSGDLVRSTCGPSLHA